MLQIMETYGMLESSTILVIVTLLLWVIHAVFSNNQHGKDGLPKLFFKDNVLNRFILQKCPRLVKPFLPVFWARNSHVQTVIRTFLPYGSATFQREICNLSDGGILALDWLDLGKNLHNLQENSPILIILPGLTGVAAEYGRSCCHGFDHGFRPVVFNKRGHGGCPLATPKMQSFGNPSDFREVVEHIQRKYPTSKIVAIGASAGSGLLASYLGHYGEDAILVAGVCISPGYDSKELFSKNAILPFYDKIMVKNLKQLVMPHKDMLAQVVDMDEVMKVKSVEEFEEKFYAKLHGYPDMDAYWAENNPVRAIENIKIPVLCVSALDDQVCKKNLIPMEMFKAHDKSMLAATDYGGHVGFWEGHRVQSWSDDISVQYLGAVLEYEDQHTD